MARYATETGKSPEEVMESARTAFVDGFDLKVIREESSEVALEGGGGHIVITVTPRDDGSQVEIETREWDIQVQKWMGEL